MIAQKDSTRLGDVSANAVRVADYVFDFVIPLTLVTVYRMIPDRIRGHAFGGPSTSQQAVAGLWQGLGWSAVREAISNHPPRPHLP